MDVRFLSKPPDAIKGVTPVKKQGMESEEWQKARKRARKQGQEDKESDRRSEQKNAPIKKSGPDEKPENNGSGHVVDVLI